MLIQKTFHLHALREVAKVRLADVASYRRHFSGVEMAVLSPGGKAHFVCRLPWGFHADVELMQLPSANPSQTLFQSIRGNIHILGVLEYFEIRPSLTEIVLTLDYTIVSPMFRFIDRFVGSVDRFLDRQLDRLETHFAQPLEGIRADTNLPKPINHHPQAEAPGNP